MMRCFVRYKKIFVAVFVLLVLLLFLLPQSAFALDLGKEMAKVFNLLIGWFMKGLEWILGLFQFLFLQVIDFTILDFATSWKDNGLLSGLRLVWQILRDFVNLAIVIIFIITAMMTSFGDGRFGFHRKSLVHLIGAAIFVNFSAFFTLLIIDISHIAFMLFFNALPLDSLGSLSPFSGYSEILGQVASPWLNIIVALIAIVVNWFVILGLLYFCVLLIERYIIALFLVLLSPLATLGLFAGMAGGNAIVSKFSSLYKSWSERLAYVFTMPVILILGFTLILTIFRSALGEAVSPENFVNLLGLSNSEGRQALLQLIMGSIVLIFGIFQVGKVAKSAGLHPAIAKKFNFGEQVTKFFGPKTGLGLLRSVKNLRNPAKTGLIEQGRQRFIKEGSTLSKIPGVGKPLDLGGKARRTKRAVSSFGKGTQDLATGRSVQDISLRSAENIEERRINAIIRTGTQKERITLLKQAADSKSRVKITPEQSAALARSSEKLHPYIAGLDKDQVSARTLDTIYKSAQKTADDIVQKGGVEDVDASIRQSYGDFRGAKAKEREAESEYNELFEQAVNDADGEQILNLEETVRVDTNALKQARASAKTDGDFAEVARLEGKIEQDQRDIESKKSQELAKGTSSMYAQFAAKNDELEKQKAATAAIVDSIDNLKGKRKGVSGALRRSAETTINVATNAAADVGTIQQASKNLDPDELKKATDERQNMTDILPLTNTMRDRFATAGKLEKADLNKQEAVVDQEITTKIADRDAAAQASKQSVVDTLNAEIATFEKQKQSFDKRREEINNIQEDLEDKENKFTDPEKLSVLRESTGHATHYVSKGIQDINTQLADVGAAMKHIESTVANYQNDTDYQNLERQKGAIGEQQKELNDLATSVQEVSSSLSAQGDIMRGAAYQQAVQKERKLKASSVSTILKEVTREMERVKKTYRQKNNVNQKSKDKNHEKEGDWKDLDVLKKRLETIQKQGGASPEIVAKIQEEVKKASTKKRSSK